MLIPIIPSDSDTDGSSLCSSVAAAAVAAYAIRFELSPEGTYPVFNVRIPLLDGEEDSAAMLLSGSISRVDAAVADRITGAVVEKTAEEYSRIVSENRRLGLHLLPFRVYCLVMSADGKTGFPSAQPVMLPSENPPHPEITASSVSTGCMSLSLRIPVCPCRLSVVLPDGCEGKFAVHTFVSYPVYIPDSEEISGSLGSVSSASGGNVLGVRFSFLSDGNMKSSVAAPEKYYRLYGNANTGYRLSSKAAPAADYSVYTDVYQALPAFAVASLVAKDSSADPFSWIADWEKSDTGCVPVSVPYAVRGSDASPIWNETVVGNGDDAITYFIPEAIDAGITAKLLQATGWRYFVFTRPMVFASEGSSRRNVVRTAVKSLHILGLPDSDCLSVLFGSDDGCHYEPLRLFDPHVTFLLLSPPRLFHRLLFISSSPFSSLAIDVFF